MSSPILSSKLQLCRPNLIECFMGTKESKVKTRKGQSEGSAEI